MANLLKTKIQVEEWKFSVLFIRDPENGQWAALALEKDQAAQGATPVEALSSLKRVIKARIIWDKRHYQEPFWNLDLAPLKYFILYESPRCEPFLAFTG